MCTRMIKTNYWADSVSQQDFSVFNFFFHLSYFNPNLFDKLNLDFLHFEFFASQLYFPMSRGEEILYYGKSLGPEAKYMI